MEPDTVVAEAMRVAEERKRMRREDAVGQDLQDMMQELEAKLNDKEWQAAEATKNWGILHKLFGGIIRKAIIIFKRAVVGFCFWADCFRQLLFRLEAQEIQVLIPTRTILLSYNPIIFRSPYNKLSCQMTKIRNK